MASIAEIRIAGPAQRRLVQQTVQHVSEGVMVTFKEPTRSLGQNAKLHAMITDVAKAMPEGRVHSVQLWKVVFMHAYGHEIQFVNGLDNSGPVPVGPKTSALSVRQMSDLIEVIYEYGSRHGVEWKITSASGFSLEQERLAA